MTKQEFLTVLQEALSEELNGAQVNEQVNYYRRYIEEQVAGGRTESEVLDELGDARIIAHNVIDGLEAEGQTYQRTTVTYTEGESGENAGPTWKTKVKVYGTIALIIALIFVILALVTKLIIWLLPSIIVIAVVLWILRKLDGR